MSPASDREFGIEGEPDSGIPGGDLAAGGQVTMETTSRETVTRTEGDDGSDSDAGGADDTDEEAK